MKIRVRNPGEFCWINMLTPKPDEARAFFGTLLGWTYVEMPGMGHRVQIGGHDIGGLFDLAGPGTPPGTPPLIGVMVKVVSADATVERVIALGGKANPAFDIMEQGRMAVCFDPNGAEFDVWQAKKGPGMEVDPEAFGAPTWFETLTTDAARATAFYTALFGWMAGAKELPGFTYTEFKLGDQYVAGLMPIQPEMGAMRPHWGTYFAVRDIEVAARDSVRLGGTLCVPVREIPGVGKFCGLISPQGVMFYALQYVR